MEACAYCVCGRVFVCEYVRAGECVCMASRCTPAAAEYLPAPQLMQVLAEVAPTVVEYLPASQLVQKVDSATYVHTLAHTTLYKFLHLYISR